MASIAPVSSNRCAEIVLTNVSFLILWSDSKSEDRKTRLVALKKLHAIFYQTTQGNEPVRVWLKTMPADDRRAIGNDIATVEFGWPVGMPNCRPLGGGLWEVRSHLPSGRIARVIFLLGTGRMVLLHGLIKKTQKTPEEDLDLARRRQKEVER